MRFDRERLLLYAVTDRAWTGEKSLDEQVEAALKGGVTCVQLREKERSEAELLGQAVQMKALCHQYGVPFIVNDNVSVAIRSGADGVHVGQSDMHAAAVRARIGPGRILGVSVRTVAQALRAQESGADYLGAGAVFPTATKADADYVNYKRLQEICAAVHIPVVAIGGINTDNLMALRGAGVAGVALVSAIFASRDIEETCRTLLRLSGEMVRT